MKKFLATILCIIYVAASSGATINFHYCMGKFIGLDFAASSAQPCSNCGMAKEQKKNCCNDKHATLQFKKDQLATTTSTIPENSFALINQDFAYNNYRFFIITGNTIQAVYKPPLLFSSTFILNCVFRI